MVGVTSSSVSLVSPLASSAKKVSNCRGDVSKVVAHESPCLFSTVGAKQ